LQFGLAEAATKKYASLAALGWVGVLMIAVGGVRQRFGPGHPLNAVPIAGALLVVLPLSAIGYRRETLIWQYAADRSTEDAMAAFVHVDDAQFLPGIFSPPPALLEYLEDLETHGNGVFSRFPFRWGDDIKPFLASLKKATCRGAVDPPVLLRAGDLNGMFPDPGARFRVSGWSWLDRYGPAATVVAADERDRIVGLAQTTRTSAVAEEQLKQTFDANVGWLGFARLDGPSALRFFAIAADYKHVCALGGDVHVR
jgi:hypothetical protein